MSHTASKLKCIHVVPSLAREASGPTHSVVRLCHAMLNEGAGVQLLALDWAPLENPPSFLKTFKLGRGSRRLGRSPAMCRFLKSQAKDGSVQILHSHILWQLNSCYPSWAIAGTGVKLISSPRGSLSRWAMASGSPAKKIFWPLFQKPALQAAHCIHATGDQEYEDIRRLGFKQPVAVIPNGVELPSSVTKVQRKKTVLYFGRLHPVKGIDNLLQAWVKIEDTFPDWDLIIRGPETGYHGGSEYAEFLRQLAIELGLQRCSFPGPLYGDEKVEAYQSASLFVLPTHSENFGLTVAEALACGTPVIVTKGAPWEYLHIKGAGWWIDIGVEPLCHALREAMAASPEELARMGALGRQWMKEDFDWNGIGKKMLETYMWLVHSGDMPSHVILD